MKIEQVREIRNKTRESEDEMKARQSIFGISFKEIEENIDLLCDLLNKHIAEFNIEMRGKKKKYWVSTNELKIRKSNPFTYLEITGKGTYFEDREIITFCDSGFIGFCGEADNENEIPVLTAFVEWLELVKMEKSLNA
jgi:hypothetical protein